VRGDLLATLGRVEEARAEFARAAALTSNEAECAHLLGRADGCDGGRPLGCEERHAPECSA
jgi:predicted RNA polymerase sigma factor